MGRLAKRSERSGGAQNEEELGGDPPVPTVTSCVSSAGFHKIFLHPSNKFLIANASLSEYLFLETKWSFRLGCKT